MRDSRCDAPRPWVRALPGDAPRPWVRALPGGAPRSYWSRSALATTCSITFWPIQPV